MTIDNPRLLRDAFGAFMTGVTVVTTTGPDGLALGFTANSFSSVSLDPPLLLVSLSKRSTNYASFTEGQGFAVNILSEDQKKISNTFARPAEDRFNGLDWQPGPHGGPVLGGVSAWFDCALERVVEAGDHAILIGRVEAFDNSGQAGLGYYRGTYFKPAQTAAQLAAGPAVVVSALLQRDGQVLLVDNGQGGLGLPTARAGEEGASATLQRLIAATGLEAEPSFVYALWEDVKRGQQHIVFLCAAVAGAPTRGRGFVELTESTLGDVTDPALQVMLRRFAEESRIGDFGIYYGNQNAGRVRRVAAEAGQ